MTIANRQYKRIPTNMVTHFRKSHMGEAYIKNISMGGVFLETHHEMELGQLVEFDFYTTTPKTKGKQKISIVGVVRWCKTDLPKGVGIEIKKMTTPDRNNLQEYVEGNDGDS